MLHMGEVWTSIFEEEIAVSRNGLVFTAMTISDRRGARHTNDAVTDEAREEVQYNNRYTYVCFRPCEPPFLTIVVLKNCSARTNALQHTDAILNLLHSFTKRDWNYAYIYIHTNLAQYQTATVKISCLAHYDNKYSPNLLMHKRLTVEAQVIRGHFMEGSSTSTSNFQATSPKLGCCA